MKLRKIEWLALLIIVLLLVIAAAAVGSVMYREFQAAVAVAPPADAGQTAALTTAQEAYPVAEAAARRWRNDAFLTGVSAVWRQPAEARLQSGKTNWVFSFYSPSARKEYIVPISGRTLGASIIREAKRTPAPLSPANWQVDSPQAIRDFLDHSGRQFLRHNPQANVHLQLATSAQGQPEWRITALSAPDRPTLLYFVSANGNETRIAANP